jgi:hypothetical protein
VQLSFDGINERIAELLSCFFISLGQNYRFILPFGSTVPASWLSSFLVIEELNVRSI